MRSHCTIEVAHIISTIAEPSAHHRRILPLSSRTTSDACTHFHVPSERIMRLSFENAAAAVTSPLHHHAGRLEAVTFLSVPPSFIRNSSVPTSDVLAVLLDIAVGSTVSAVDPVTSPV